MNSPTDTVNLGHAVLEPDKAYILQECSQLRHEIWTRVDDQRKTERYTLLACAFIYFFLVSKEANPAAEEVRTLGWYVPPLLSFLAAARWREGMYMVHRIADYTETRETQILGRGGGWERYLHRLRKKRAPLVLMSGYYAAFWLLLIFSTSTIATYQHLKTWRLALLIGTLAALGTLALLVGRALISRIRTYTPARRALSVRDASPLRFIRGFRLRLSRRCHEGDQRIPDGALHRILGRPVEGDAVDHRADDDAASHKLANGVADVLVVPAQSTTQHTTRVSPSRSRSNRRRPRGRSASLVLTPETPSSQPT
jgi:hypothetical protein